MLETMHYLEISQFLVEQENDICDFLGIEKSENLLIQIEILSVYEEDLSQFSQSEFSQS